MNFCGCDLSLVGVSLWKASVGLPSLSKSVELNFCINSLSHCKTEYCKLCDFKRHTFMPHTVSVGQKFRLAQLVRARVSQAGVEVPARTGLSPETRGPHLRSRKLLVEFRSLRSCFLSGGSQGSHSASRGCPEALLTGPSPYGAAGDVFRASQGLSLRWSPVRCD